MLPVIEILNLNSFIVSILQIVWNYELSLSQVGLNIFFGFCLSGLFNIEIFLLGRGIESKKTGSGLNLQMS